MLNGAGEGTVPATPPGSAGRSSVLLLSLAALLVSIVLLAVGVVMFRSGESARADARE